MREIEQNFPLGTSAWTKLEKLGLGISIFTTGQQLYTTIEDPTYWNISKASARSLETGLAIGAALGSQFARRAVPWVSAVLAVEDVVRIGQFGFEVYGLGSDILKLGSSELKTAIMTNLLQQQKWYQDGNGILDVYEATGQHLRAGSIHALGGQE
jgi:hypothetical protein